MSQQVVVGANVFYLDGSRVLCDSVGSSSRGNGTCIEVWEAIPDDAGINQGMVDAAKSKWPNLPAEDEAILLSWPAPQFRMMRRAVISLMHDAPTHVSISRPLGTGPRIDLSVEEAQGGQVVLVRLIHAGWTTTS